MALLSAAYLVPATTWSLLTPAWEANDEIDHTMYIEHIVAHGSIPRISLANGIESHQPPLYYLLAAGWQKLLGIPAFTPSAAGGHHTAAQAASGHYLALDHRYTPLQHQNAVYLHELRLLSVLLGLATVLLAYGCARAVFRHASTALCAGLTVAWFPKQLVVDSVVTNDSLVITLCALALYLFLLSERARQARDGPRRRALVLALGIALGLAAITKFNSLPLAVVLVVLVGLPAVRKPALADGPALAVAGFLSVSAWWFARNKALYGQFLATTKSLSYLKKWPPGLVVPVPWTNSQRFLHFVPGQLFQSVWYDGDWNQWVLPHWANVVLWSLALVSCASAIMAMRARGRRRSPLRPSAGTLALASLPAAMVAGLAAVVIIAKDTVQAEGRVAFVGLLGFVLILALGSDLSYLRPSWGRALAVVWPLAVLAVDVYVLCAFLVPLGGL